MIAARIILPCLLLLTCLGGSEVAAQGRPAAVVTDAVRLEPLSQTIPVIGRFVAKQTGPVAALTTGAVAEVAVAVGDRVAEGDLIARIATDTLDAQVARARAALETEQARIRTAEARAALTKGELDRLDRLRRSAAFSEARFDDKQQELATARSAAAEARAERRMAEADLALASIALGHARVLAPYPGVITQKLTERGAFVRVGDPVVVMVNDAALEIEVDVPFTRLAGIQSGSSVVVGFTPGERLPATVRAIIPQENALSRTRAVRIAPGFDPSSFGIAENTAVTVQLPIGAVRDVVSVHKDAVIQRGGGDVVYRVSDATAELVPVELGEAVGQRFVVRSGLAPGDQVVVRGNERLRPGQALVTGPPGGAASNGPPVPRSRPEDGGDTPDNRS